jgi:SAM-dependent methyltransferase
METIRQWAKSTPLRAWFRPLKRAVVRPGVSRALRQREWERKWKFEEGLNWKPEEVAPEVAAAVESGWLPEGASILDLGCGSGENAAWLASQGYEVLGVDVSRTAIERARVANGTHAGLSLDVVDVSAPVALTGRTFDAIIDRGCLHGLPEPLQQVYAKNVTTWARPGAPFLLIMHAQSSRRVEQRMAQVIGLLGDGFTIEGRQRVDALAYRHGKVLGGVAFRLRRRDPARNRGPSGDPQQNGDRGHWG